MNPESGELWRGDRAIDLPPLPAKALAMLAATPDELVSREALRDGLWGNSPPVEWEKSLYFCILQVRRALGDGEGLTRHVETVPRRGYRLVRAPEAVDRSGVRAGRWALAALALAVTLVLVAFGRWFDAPEQVGPQGEADRLVREADYLLDQRRPELLSRARDRYLRALALAPNRAEALSGLAYAEFLLQLHGELPSGSGRDAARRALSLDGQQVAAHLVVGEYAATLDWDLEAALAAMDRAQALAPDDPDVRAHRAGVLLMRGEYDAAATQVEATLEDDPGSALLAGDAAWILYFARHDRRAEWAARRALELDPDHRFSRETLIHALAAQGRQAEAEQEAGRFLADHGNPDPTLDAGPSAVVTLHRTVLEALGQAPSTAPWRALRLAALGERAAALEQLEQAYRTRSPALIRVLGHPHLAGLADEPRFIDLVRGMGLDPGRLVPNRLSWSAAAPTSRDRG